MANEGIVKLQSVIDALERMVAGGGVSAPDDIINVDDAIEAVKKIPKVVIKPREAEWMLTARTKGGNEVVYVQCSNCLKTNKVYDYDFCPHCGRRMRNAHQTRRHE